MYLSRVFYYFIVFVLCTTYVASEAKENELEDTNLGKWGSGDQAWKEYIPKLELGSGDNEWGSGDNEWGSGDEELGSGENELKSELEEWGSGYEIGKLQGKGWLKGYWRTKTGRYDWATLLDDEDINNYFPEW